MAYDDIQKLIQYIANNDDIAIEAAGVILGLIRRVKQQDKLITEGDERVYEYVNRRDLFARRADLARRILADDETALTVEQLEEVAEAIWPDQESFQDTVRRVVEKGPSAPIPTDPTQVPTSGISFEPSKPIQRADELFWAANAIMRMFEFLPGIDIGTTREQLIQKWREDTNQYRRDYGLEFLEPSSEDSQE